VTVFRTGFPAGTPELLGLGALGVLSLLGVDSFGGAAVSARPVLLSSLDSVVAAGAFSERCSMAARTLVWELPRLPAGVGEITFCRRASTSSALICGPKMPGLSLRPLVFLNGELGFDCITPSTVTKLARTLESCLVDPEVAEPTGDLPREGGEVMGLSPFSNLASRLRTPGWALLSDMV